MAHFTEALALHRQIDNRLGEALALEGLAEVAAAREQLEPATRLLAAAARLWEQLPGRLPSHEQESTERLLARLRSGLDEAGFAAAWAEGWADLIPQPPSPDTRAADRYPRSGCWKGVPEA